MMLLILVLGLVCAGRAAGQGSRKDDIILNSRGMPLAGATVRVCAMPATGQPCIPLALIYSDAALTQAIANPTTTDGLGNYYFYAAPGKYEIEVSGPGIITKQTPNVILPSDPSSPTFNNLSTTGTLSAFTLNLSGNLTVNGNTTVAGGLASGTMNLTNQGTAPGAASAGTVNLYTKSTDKRLYYKDDTGAELGPLAGGAQQNQPNTWTAQQNFDANTASKGPNPWYDITRYGGYIGPNFDTPVQGTISSGSHTLTISSAQDYQTGQGILVYGAGPATLLSAPQAPTVTPLWQQGSTPYSYCIASVDYFGGVTACGAQGSTTTGPASMGLINYTVSSQSSIHNGTVRTINTTTAHNIPTARYHSNAYPQIELQNGPVGCNGAATLTGVPNSTSVTISSSGQGDNWASCTSGNLTIRTRMELKWENHTSRPISNYTCNAGNTATITVPNLWDSITAMPSNLFNISGSSDATYNASFAIADWSVIPTVRFSVACNTVTDTGNFGGQMNFMQNHAVKVHLIYRCQNTAANCTLPGNAANYSLVGAASGDDTYFIDEGYGASATNIDLGQYPATAPTSATSQYLDTLITAGGGSTTLTLRDAASANVTGAQTWHDNVPNIYAACAAMPNNGGIYTSAGGTIYIPAVTGYAFSNRFPIFGNLLGMNNYAGPGFRQPNCSGVKLLVAAPVFQRGMIEWGGTLEGIAGGYNCASVSYFSDYSACFQGYSYPMLHFYPQISCASLVKNAIIAAPQNYQIGILDDSDLSTGGCVNQTFDNVQTQSGAGSIGWFNRAGFGFFWKGGGWGSTGTQTDYSNGRAVLFRPNCNGSAYQTTPPLLPYIVRSYHDTYLYGVVEVDDCGTFATFSGDWYFERPLSEGIRGTQWKVSANNPMSDIHIEDPIVADPTGPGGPQFDLTNTRGGVEVISPLCYGPLFEVSPTSTYSLKVKNSPGKFCGTSGVDPAWVTGASIFNESDYISQTLLGNYSILVNGPTGKVAGGQVATPSSAPNVSVSSTCPNHNGWPGNGTPTTNVYHVAALDVLGNSTLTGPLATGVTLNGTSQCAYITEPVMPAGTVCWNAYLYSSTNGSSTGLVQDRMNPACPNGGTPTGYTTIIDQAPYKLGSEPVSNSTSLQTVYSSGIYGNFFAATEGTEGQCFSAATPAVCGSFINGFVAIPAGVSSVVVNTTAVTANSEISLTFDTTQGANLGVTCNISPQQPYISARTAGTSFTIAVPSNFATNPGCIGFHIKN